MIRRARQRQLAAAELQLAEASAGLHASAARLRVRIDRYGPFALLGAGAAAGAVGGLLPLGTVARVARSLTGAALFLLRTPTTAWLGALRMHDRDPPTDRAR